MATDAYMDVLDELRDLTMRKRKGYSPGADPYKNFRMTEMFSVPCQCGCGVATPIPPIFGIMIREMDKMARIASLLAKPSNDEVGETIRETLMDAGNYPLIGVAFMDSEPKVGPASAEQIIAEIEASRARDTGFDAARSAFDTSQDNAQVGVFDSSDGTPPEDDEDEDACPVDCYECKRENKDGTCECEDRCCTNKPASTVSGCCYEGCGGCINDAYHRQVCIDTCAGCAAR